MITIQILSIFHSFNPEVIPLVIALVVLILITAFCSASETAFFSLSSRELAEISESNTKSGNTIISLLARQDYLLATILIANNLANISIVIISDRILADIFNFAGYPILEFLTTVIIVTFILLIFGETVPKVFAANNSQKLSHIAALPFAFLKVVFKPLSWLMIKTSRVIGRALSKKQKVNISMDELSNAIEITDPQTEEERQMLSGIVSFVNTDVDVIMKPRLDVVAIDIDSDFEEVRRVILDSGFSRIPIYEESLDNVKGVLYIKDLLPNLNERRDFRWQQHLRQPFFVPESKKISDLLAEFQMSKVHIAIVVDEYGSTMGLVSLEDILEEVVGEIMDETDAEEREFYTRLNDHAFLFDGKTHLSDVAKALGLDDDFFEKVRGGAETLAGLMLEIKGDFVEEGETVEFDYIKMRVDEIEHYRINKIYLEITNI